MVFNLYRDADRPGYDRADYCISTIDLVWVGGCWDLPKDDLSKLAPGYLLEVIDYEVWEAMSDIHLNPGDGPVRVDVTVTREE